MLLEPKRSEWAQFIGNDKDNIEDVSKIRGKSQSLNKRDKIIVDYQTNLNKNVGIASVCNFFAHATQICSIIFFLLIRVHDMAFVNKFNFIHSCARRYPVLVMYSKD